MDLSIGSRGGKAPVSDASVAASRRKVHGLQGGVAMRAAFRHIGLRWLGFVLLIVGLGLFLAPASRAQDAFPSRTVRIIVPFPAGSGTNILARILAAELTTKWGVSVYVD